MAKEKMTLTKPQKALLDSVIEDLKKGTVPWKKPWKAPGLPQNAKSSHEYRGENRFYLSLIMMEKGYSDPRFLTFAQMMEHNKGLPREEQLHLPKGTTGFPIGYASYYSRELKRNLTATDFKVWTQEEIEKKFAEGEIYYFQKTATVFNLEQFEGNFPAFEPEFERKTEVDLDLIEGIAKTMNLHLNVSKRSVSAYYTPTTDTVNLPIPQRFFEDIGFYGTTFHEFAHATGHPSRLNRELKGKSDLVNYAKEELRAEFSSLFLSQEINLPLSQEFLEQGSSYIGGWLSVLENNPEILFEAAKDAGEICDYLLHHIKTFEVARKLRPEFSDPEKKITPELIVVGYDHSWIYIAMDELDLNSISVLEEDIFRDTTNKVYPYFEIEKWDDYYALAQKTRMRHLNDGFPWPEPKHDDLAVKVGTEFVFADKKEISGIDLMEAGQSINLRGQRYPLYKGSTFEESQKVDALMDSGEYETFKISEYEEEDFDLSL